MPYPIPTLSTLQTQAANDITQSSIPGADGLLQKSILRALALVQSGMAFQFFGYLDWIAQQSVPFTATDEFLEAWGALKAVLRKDASAAAGTNAVSFTGTPTTPLPDNTALTRSDGFTFTTVGAATVANTGTVTASLVATLPGSLGNTAIGTLISLSNSISGITAGGTVTGLIVGGADQETDDAFRARMLEAYQAPPQGGDASDYVEWALAVPGVTRAWCSPTQMGAGTVVVYVMLDNSEAANGGFPQGTNGVAAGETRDTPANGDQLTVANALFPLQPVTALVYAFAPVPQPVSFTFAELTPNTAAIRTLIVTALQGMFLRLGTATSGTIYQSDWETAIAATPGLANFIVTTPSTSIGSGVGYLPVLGTVTWPA